MQKTVLNPKGDEDLIEIVIVMVLRLMRNMEKVKEATTTGSNVLKGIIYPNTIQGESPTEIVINLKHNDSEIKWEPRQTKC